LIASSPENILVIIIARIGDTLLLTPAIHALRNAFPEAHLEVLAHPKRKCVLENNPDIDKLSGYTLMEYLRGLLHYKRYDIVLVYGEDSRLIKYARSRGRMIIGFEQKDAGLQKLLDVFVKKPDAPMHAVDERLLLVKALGLTNSDRRLIYRISDEEKKWADTFIKNLGLYDTDIKIGFQIAGFPTKAYRDWPAEHFISLGKFILKESNAKILLFGDKKDINKARHIHSAIGGRVLIIAGKTNLRQTASLLPKCNVFVTTDTGPMHIAFALEVPTVALFHCMHRGENLGPTTKAEIHRIIQMEPLRGEECGRHLTMETVESSIVWDSIKDILKYRNLI